MPASNRKLPVVGFVILVLVCVGCCALVRIYNLSVDSGLESAARRLGVEPSSGAIAEYIEEAVEVGMPREEVEQVLYGVAPFVEIEPRTTEYISDPSVRSAYLITLRFQRLPSPHFLSIVAYYDSSDRLVFLGDLGGEYFRVGGDHSP